MCGLLFSHTFDLYSSVPYKRMPEKERKVIWDDIVHFTPKGYDLVGSRIAERMVEILKDLEDSETSKLDPPREELKK
jgi:lysophospholipase L1-like esterase